MVLLKCNSIHKIECFFFLEFYIKEKKAIIKLNATLQCEVKAHTEFNPECRLLYSDSLLLSQWPKTLCDGLAYHQGWIRPLRIHPPISQCSDKSGYSRWMMKLYFRFGQNRTNKPELHQVHIKQSCPRLLTAVLCSTCFVSGNLQVGIFHLYWQNTSLDHWFCEIFDIDPM